MEKESAKHAASHTPTSVHTQSLWPSSIRTPKIVSDTSNYPKAATFVVLGLQLPWCQIATVAESVGVHILAVLAGVNACHCKQIAVF